ncbi:30S ribosomal S17P protein [Fusarium denticulatum]|uniref:30S ribosomal S17P protein n=1 Tax=Fusarium denticulatum TaxID=48507 RepID=A0A8H5X394_9HYPO|nr:30S ribosomal S17P protein [Fusarium denticulatum]
MALEQTQEGSDDWATHACNLSGYLLTLYHRTGEQLDLGTSITLARGSVDATPASNGLRHIRLGNLTACLIARFDSTGSFEHLEECVRMGKEAKEATPKEHIEWPARLHDLGAIMQRRYQMTEDLEDLDKAIGLTQQALLALGPNHPQQADTMSLMALFFAKRYGETESPEDLQRTEFFYRAALFQTHSPIITRIEAGVKLISVCMVQRNMEQAFEDAKYVVDLIPQMAVRSLESSDKQDLLLKIGGVSSEAAGLALHLGENPMIALSLLEKGRGMFALSLDEMRADINSLEEQCPDLASRFVTIHEQLSASSGLAKTLDTDDVEWNVDESRRHEAGNEFERLIGEIRQQSGFHTFLLPPSESEIKLAAERGPIVIINTSMLRCDALLVESHQVTSVPLTDFNRRDMTEYVRNDTFKSDEALQWLWDCVASPVLNALGFDKPPCEGDWPHIWWIMTGLLNKFPIHAAGLHLRDCSETVIDRVISSYHGSIQSIIRGRKRPTSAATQTYALLVAMEDTPGSSKLPFPTREITAIRGICKSILIETDEPEPKRDNILSSLLECGIFHFAGHARTDPEDLIGNYLCLDDEKEKCLTVLDLLDLNLQSCSPFLAYLSACGTGRIDHNDLVDEGIHLINGFHRAGFRHVIGTLWEVKDDICVDMARITYEGMMQNGATDEAVSRGLHEASRELRDGWVTLAGTDDRKITSSRVGAVETLRDGSFFAIEASGSSGYTRRSGVRNVSAGLAKLSYVSGSTVSCPYPRQSRRPAMIEVAQRLLTGKNTTNAASTMKLSTILPVFGHLVSFCQAQADPNTLASKSLVKTITGFDPLSIDNSILPSFPAGKHPLIVQAGYDKDIRMTALNIVPLQIDALMQGSLIVPFVDVTKDRQTPIGVPVNYYIGGTNGQPLQAIVPSVASGVSPFEGTTIFPATFSPDTSAARALPNGFNSIQVKPFLLPNTISGPGIYAEAFDISFKATDNSPYTPHTFHSLLNIPQLNTNKCQRNTVYFNESSSEPLMAIGEVTLYHQILATPPQGLEGVYRDVYCYSANGQVVSSVGEPCKAAAANMDPEAKV